VLAEWAGISVGFCAGYAGRSWFIKPMDRHHPEMVVRGRARGATRNPFGKLPMRIVELTAVMYPAMMEHPMHSECATFTFGRSPRDSASRCSVDEI
jgi:hypothetical protein